MNKCPFETKILNTIAVFSLVAGVSHGAMAKESQALWVAGRKDEAAAVITDDFILKTVMIGTEDMVAERIRRCRDAGITTLRLTPTGRHRDEQIHNLEYLTDLIHRVA